VTLGHKSHIQQAGANILIDTQYSDAGKLLDWVHEYNESYPKCLRRDHRLYAVGDEKSISDMNAFDYFLDPWRQLSGEIVRVDSNANVAIIEMGLNIPNKSIEFKIVEKITLRSEINAETLFEQSPKWEGPVAFSDNKGCVLISAIHFAKGNIDARKIKDIDAIIAEEVLHCLGDTSFFKPNINNIQRTLSLLERPSTVLQNLKVRNRSHFIYQYQDQVADPEFTNIFDEYQKTKNDSARHKDLEDKLYTILSNKFVDARREQIRGYGYDELSVITELLQNAEDAYAQRAWLGMEMPETCKVTFFYEKDSVGNLVLNVEHGGRPFNYYRHGEKEDPTFARDVEGVLRSAGSYKPHTNMDDVKDEEANGNIGRFGLGFKSVFLLTDCPEIHSGHWHFAIENGCIPVEKPAPENWDPYLTRIILPLNPGMGDEPTEDRLAQLLPFLRMITAISIIGSDGRENVITRKTTRILEDDRFTVQDCLIEINEQLIHRLIRVQNNSAQLAMLVDSKGLPIRWTDFFESDLYAFLPLKSQLGCGIAVSHRFQVQSGRTHLTNNEDNKQYAQDVATRLLGLTKALDRSAVAQGKKGVSAYLMRFWQLWDWSDYDAECKFIIDKVAQELLRIACSESVVPTYDAHTAISLDDEPFYFADIPGAFREALLENGFCISVGNENSIRLSETNVVPEGFVSSLRLLAEYTDFQLDKFLFRVSWEQIVQECGSRPWLAEKPELLNILASSLSEERLDDVSKWVSKCRVAGMGGIGNIKSWFPNELFHGDIVYEEYLPKRLLRVVDKGYSDHA